MKKIILAIISFLFISLSFCAAEFQKAVVLPARFAQNPIVVVDSSQYKDLLSKNKDLQFLLDQEKKDKEKFSKQIDEQAAKNSEVQSQLLLKSQKDDIIIEKLQKEKAQSVLLLWKWRLMFWGLVGLIVVYFGAKYWLSANFPFLKLLP